MASEFDEVSKLHIERDESGVARQLHLDEPYLTTARTPQLAAGEYLEKFGDVLGVQTEQLRKLVHSPAEAPVEAPVEYRYLEEKTQFDTTTVVFNQTCLGLPVWEAGIAVQIAHSPMRVIALHSTHHPEVHVEPPAPRALTRLERLDTKALTKALGLSGDSKTFDLDSLAIESVRLIVYRYEADQRVRAAPEPPERSERSEEEAFGHSHELPPVPLPPVDRQLEEGQHYVAGEVIFVLGTEHVPGLRWVALIDAQTLSVLLLRPFVETVDGLIFAHDPTTLNGGPPPTAPSASLNPLRTSVVLPGLQPPAGGEYALAGDIVALSDLEPPPIPAPTEPIGTDFDFDARSNDFAAVNAYYHCDRFFRLIRDLGFDLAVYLGGTPLPTAVDHRGRYGSATGVEINAHCLGTGKYGILRTTFMLAETTNVAQPVGLACDYRVVLHELGGHGILYNHVNSANFHFSHSAGDSFGAVLSDAESRAPDRFESFPWISLINRRHDRSPAQGWGWSGAIALHPFGALDLGGYNNEQILSTTHFRLYRSLGGDSTEVEMRRFAGRYVAYLILRTVGSLTQATSPTDAAHYASALIGADLGNWTTEDQVGGAYWKVIRWAFEKQGLYQPAGTPTPNNKIGSPPPVDVYIDDGRDGEYQYVPSGGYFGLQRFWETTEIWNRLEADGHTEHQTPVIGRVNHAYVRIRKRGLNPAGGVVVHGYHCRPTAGLVWPDDLHPMRTASLTIPGSIPSGGQRVVGPFEWRPEHAGHECMFMSVNASGDRANTDPATFLPAAAGPSPFWRLVPCDNNLGLRGVIPVPGGGGRHALVEAFHGRTFWASNPFARTGKVEVRATLPGFLQTRGWALHLDNPGGSSFSLGPRGTREIRLRMIGGQSFTKAEVVAAGRVAIELVVLVDGLVVGGLTYVVDPDLKWPAREWEDHDDKDKDEDKEQHEDHPDENGEQGRSSRAIHLRIDID